MRAIVTGASGLLGSELVCTLVSAGYDVIAISRRDISQLSKYRSLKLKGARYVSLDIAETEKLFHVIKRHWDDSQPISVFHLAWWGDVKLSDLSISKQYQNVTNTVNLYRVCSRLNVDKFIFAGTMEEAFALEYTKMDHRCENKYNRHVVYALAKHTARNALKHCYFIGAPEIIFATNSHIMGLEDDKDSFLQVALSTILSGSTLSMSSGEQIFDVIDVEDCARAYVAISQRGRNGASYWIGSGAPRPLKDYVIEMNNKFGPVTVNYGTQPFDDVKLSKSTFNTITLVKDTQFLPKISFKDSCAKLAVFLGQYSR